ncbi:septum site-determining protein MinC [Liquorilactobacillus capillatus]|uniref:Cell division inhibitor n=1 Tax=Liquorilactobacillus capillatus DSM 19910 TaxID=1423731 RepID=A0A0R1LWE1_9LACO|nr:septum site-determining protein MinC [Liquorilactobacillus capillatus]KRL00086.1 cell division inhibitor [Liquorilactobacillus capillatus DSM 19910]
MQNVVLKGYKDGYEITLNADADFNAILAELTKLFAELQLEKEKSEAKSLSFDISTGTRLLNAEQKQQVEKIVSRYPLFSIHRFTSSVMQVQDALEMIESRTVHLNASTIRNGQTEDVKGDVLFVGDLHQGGILRSTGNIFTFGKNEGILHAGYPNDATAIIIGNIHTTQQVRVADVVDIVEDDKVQTNDETVVFVNDLHVLEYTEREKVKIIRPKLFTRMGGY